MILLQMIMIINNIFITNKKQPFCQQTRSPLHKTALSCLRSSRDLKNTNKSGIYIYFFQYIRFKSAL